MKKSPTSKTGSSKNLKELQNALQQKEKELYSIQRIGKALSSTLRLDELLNLIMQEVTVLMDAERSTLFLVDKERDEIWSKVALKAEVKEIRQKMGKGISGYVALTGETINIPDAYQDTRFDPTTDKKTGYRTRSILCMPVWEPLTAGNKREIMGVVQVLNKNDGVFSFEDESLLESLTAQVAISIANSRLYHQLEKKYRELDLLYEFEQMLSGIYRLPDLIKDCLVKTLQHLQADLLFVYFPLEKEYVFAHLDNANPFEYSVKTTIPSYWAETVKDPSPENIEKSLQALKHVLHFSELQIARPVLCSLFLSKEGEQGLMVALGVQQGEKADLTDERKLLDQVSQKIARAIELNQLRESLLKQERLSAIGQMMSTVVHDIRGPVNTIYGFVDLMTEDATQPEERKEFAGIIQQEIQSLMNMITEILDFAKGKTSILPRKSSVRNLVNKFKPRIQQMCQQNRIHLNLDVHSDELLYIDEEKITRVFYNITKNAIEAMGHNGGEFSFKVTGDNTDVLFEFKDTGPGIPEEIKERIFESFVTSGKQSGTGLGLAIVKKIIDEHGGKIEIESQTGKGANFIIRLPKYSGF